jgi:hypothetical protein
VFADPGLRRRTPPPLAGRAVTQTLSADRRTITVLAQDPSFRSRPVICAGTMIVDRDGSGDPVTLSFYTQGKSLADAPLGRDADRELLTAIRNVEVSMEGRRRQRRSLGRVGGCARAAASTARCQATLRLRDAPGAPLLTVRGTVRYADTRSGPTPFGSPWRWRAMVRASFALCPAAFAIRGGRTPVHRRGSECFMRFALRPSTLLDQAQRGN